MVGGQTNINHYGKLRAWYLARLRKLGIASDQFQAHTPASLIAADKDRLQRLAATRLQSNDVDLSARLKSWKPDKLHLEQKILALLLTSLALQVAFGICLF